MDSKADLAIENERETVIQGHDRKRPLDDEMEELILTARTKLRSKVTNRQMLYIYIFINKAGSGGFYEFVSDEAAMFSKPLRSAVGRFGPVRSRKGAENSRDTAKTRLRHSGAAIRLQKEGQCKTMVSQRRRRPRPRTGGERPRDRPPGPTAALGCVLRCSSAMHSRVRTLYAKQKRQWQGRARLRTGCACALSQLVPQVARSLRNIYVSVDDEQHVTGSKSI
ncbi:hypothetical protein EVAR_93989_1 [Eumeta japonica]|uniref:Uncharacterized protein n=1 Tax=Eumeta variegata TaxID=151549 RepID=A0A4C1TPC3_EUMVA|nr:hypothetical protein EVAR_93989_1 [Eumeta japonica]